MDLSTLIESFIYLVTSKELALREVKLNLNLTYGVPTRIKYS